MNRFFYLQNVQFMLEKSCSKNEGKMVLQYSHGTIAPSINAYIQHYQPSKDLFWAHFFFAILGSWIVKQDYRLSLVNKVSN